MPSLNRLSPVWLTGLALVVSFSVALSSGVWARQSSPAKPPEPTRVSAYETHLAMEQRSPYRGLSWQFLGPTNISGRANSVAVADRGGRRRIYVGYSGSGVWKTDDNGITWQAVFTHAAATSILCVAVASSNPDTVWILTGTTRSHIPLASAGVYKSTDGARTWRQMGLEEIGSGGYGRLLIHPTNPNIVYVASTGGPDVPGKTRGVFKTMDGGEHWTRVFYRNPVTGPGDLVMDSANPNTLYVATRPRARGNEPPLARAAEVRPSIFKTIDGGATWSEISKGLPPPLSRGAISLALAGSRSHVLYALVNNQESTGTRSLRPDEAPSTVPLTRIKGPEVYRSDDAGISWRLVSSNDDRGLVPSDPQYNPTWAIRASPTDENLLYALGQSLSVSRDGGRHFDPFKGFAFHSDFNDVWIDPARPGASYVCDDGGFEVFENFGGGWSHFTTPTAQIYDVVLDNAQPFHAYGAVQDEESARGEVRLSADRTVESVPFESAPGGEATSHAIAASDQQVVYASSYNGRSVGRYDLRPGLAPRAQRVATMPASSTGTDPLRGAWLTPIMVSPHDGRRLYVGFQSFYRSSDRGATWERLSGDLSSAIPELRRPDFVNEAISTISESPKRPGLIYAGTDDGRLHLTTDGGTSWTELTDHLPHRTFVWRVIASAFDEDTVYVLLRGRDDDDFAPYLFKSTDRGQTFTSVVSNIPAGPVNVIREDLSDPARLYVGTDFGVYVTTNGGTSWQVLGGNLPSVPVTDLQIQPRDQLIVISTFGRGMWVLDALKAREPR